MRDSLTILAASLASLGKTLCPNLGNKGNINHEDVKITNLMEFSKELLDYLRQDIRLLGGIMVKVQQLYWINYNIDIENNMTLSSVAMTIFRMKFYDDIKNPIYIPNRNVDTFFRRGYYGGHADTFIPYGENLYYYDVNSLYPYVMKHYKMPSGVPVWCNNLEKQDLNNLYGFIEAYVVCPSNIIRPFLPYRDNNKTLLFPTGNFVGVYYSEELKYARDLGYQIVPLRGYLFESLDTSPFINYVSNLYESRKKAKKDGDEAMSYIYKLLMNSLYGRFGINPKSTVILEICNEERYQELMRKDNFIYGNKLNDYCYIVSCILNRGVEDHEWMPPNIVAVQLSAAITACARIHMYKYISRSDCYYTDTDLAVLGSKLSDYVVSSNEIGMFKLEYKIQRTIFLAPKSYMLELEDDNKT